ncbi:hypothetical protein H9636_16105 [Ureibacillus sp. Re31]|uniref:YopX protein domain-containing protein n=1 Tax=Ureibacillus galli TaxID=2762222 RepID=A0ABR8XG01_9BACL|nr:YopX family protein [Ureibacillus galli]MBD8028172.1 hypothetical protein [Ureibacillus galli]
MRQPKFRGFSPETNEWVYGYGWHETDYTDDFLRSINQSRQDAVLFTKTFPITCDIESMGEYTGLKDRNGKEIYEGDILLFNNSINDRKWKCVVEYREGSFVCVYQNDKVYNHFDSWNVPKVTWEVIGNIYEHPHLLGGDS